MEIEADKSETTHWSEFSMVRNSRMKDPDEDRIQTTSRLYVQWRELLGLYGRLILSKDTDRLPALSGLAKLCQSHGAGRYLAGLWENDLLKSLCWHIRTDKPMQRWEGYTAPSWSPFSVGYITRWDGLVEAGYWYLYHERYHKTWGEPLAQVSEAQCIPAGEDPTGAVKDGFLLLRGPMRKDNPDGPDHEWELSDWEDSASDNSDPDDRWTKTVWNFTFLDHPTEEINRSEIVLFLLWADFNIGYIRGLCLIPVENAPGTYTGVGIVTSD